MGCRKTLCGSGVAGFAKLTGSDQVSPSSELIEYWANRDFPPFASASGYHVFHACTTRPSASVVNEPG